MFSNNVQSSEIFPGETKLLWKSTSEQNYIKKRRPSDFSFDILKTGQKETAKPSQFFAFLPLNKINTSKLRRFSIHQSRIKRHQNYINFLSIKIKFKKIHQNHAEIFSIEITFKKLRQNDVDFSLFKITLKKMLWDDVEFLPIEITLKKKAYIT